MNEVLVGTRGSRLALAQTESVIEQLKRHHTNRKFTIKQIETEGDRLSRSSLSLLGGKGLFIKEIEEALLAGSIDLAVHSLKDMPTEQPRGLQIGAVLVRDDPRDALISRDGTSLEKLAQGSRIGTGSPRRAAQLLAWRADLKIAEIRGNVDTRVKKLEAGQFDAIVVAAAGLNRLGLQERVTEIISPGRMLPAAGQGALAVEVRADDQPISQLLTAVHDEKTFREVAAERAFLARLGGGCRAPIAALAIESEDRLLLEGLVAEPGGSNIIRGRISGSPQNGQKLAAELAAKLLRDGAREIIARFTHE